MNTEICSSYNQPSVTELLNHVIGQLSRDNVVFYVNLRGKFIREYDAFGCFARALKSVC